METVKIWRQEWFYITEPRGANWAATPEFRSKPPMWLASWTNKGLDWGSADEVKTLQKRVQSMIEKNTSLADVIQVMLFCRILPCQRRPLHTVQSGWPSDPAAILRHDARRDLEAAFQGPEVVAGDDRRHQPRLRSSGHPSKFSDF